MDGGMHEAPLGKDVFSSNSADRGKKGSKRHLLVDARGVPLSIVVIGASRHDVTRMKAVSDEIFACKKE